MKKFFRIRMSRPFDIWRKSKTDGNGNLLSIVFEYDLPTSDSIFAETTHYFVTTTLGDCLKNEGLTGFTLKSVITMVSDSLKHAPPPDPVYKLEVHGTSTQDDFWHQDKVNLIISERALSIIQSCGASEVKVFDYDPNYSLEIPAWLLDGGSNDE